MDGPLLEAARRVVDGPLLEAARRVVDGPLLEVSLPYPKTECSAVLMSE